MGRLLDAAIDFLDGDGWQYEVEPGRADTEGPRVHFRFSGEHAQYDCWIVCYEDTERVCILSIFPLVIPEDKRLRVAEYLMRANFGILVGNFELDFRDGEVRMKTSADVEDIPLTATFMKNLLVANLGTADRYFPGLGKVLFAGMAPADAIAVLRELQ